MRSLFGLAFTELLVVLLVGTSPIGTGQGVHRDQLLDPLFPHVHLVDGRIVGRDVGRPVQPGQNGVPVLGAAAGASAAAIGPGYLPPLLKALVLPPLWRDEKPFGALDDVLPRGRTEAPPDPPPTSARS